MIKVIENNLRLLFGLFVLMATMSVSAQNTFDGKAQIAKIRELYANVKENQENRKRAELPANEMVIHNEYMAPGAGPINETYHYFYSGEYNEAFRGVLYHVSFVTHKYNVGPMQCYEEILFDDDGNLVFFYEKKETKGEVRYYFDKGELIHKEVKGKEDRLEYDADLLILQRYCAETRNAFNLLMNKNY